MLQIETQSNQNIPKCFCDSCGHEITDAAAAAVVFDNFSKNGTRCTPLYVHKNFVYGDCLSQAETKIKLAGASPGWEELRTYLAHTIANVGMDADAVEKILRQPSI